MKMADAYYMSKTETAQWDKNARVIQPNRMNSTREHCRDLIRDIAKSQGCACIVSFRGDVVEEF